MIRNVIGAFLNHKRAMFSPSLLHLIGPLATVLKDECVMFVIFGCHRLELDSHAHAHLPKANKLANKQP
jgi:hypothetical protein